jgi:PAS domain S-box-containing protein
MQDAEDDAVHLAGILCEREISGAIKTAQGDLSTFEIPKELMEQMDRRLGDYLSVFNIVKIKIYDDQMRIIYSTDKDLINRIDANNTELKDALAGSEVSKHESTETIWDFEDEERKNIDVVETYVPIQSRNGRVIGAFEIYTDVTDYLSRARNNMVVIWLLVSILILAVFGLLVLLMYFTTRAVSAGTLALEKSEQRFRAVFESATESIMIWDVNKICLFANQAASDYFSIPKDQLIGASIVEGLAGVPAYMQLIVERIEEVSNTGTQVKAEDAIPLGNTLSWSESVFTPINGPKGDVFAVSMVYRDITERRESERVRDKLMFQIDSRNTELHQLASVVRHDIGNSLISIQALAVSVEKNCEKLSSMLNVSDIPNDIREKTLGLLEGSIQNSLGYIRKSADEMGNILEGLRRLAQAGRVELDIIDLDVNEIVGDIIGMMKVQIENCGACVKVASLPSCKGDATQISQVFLNLLTNATKYLDPDRPGMISIFASTDQGMVTYTIEDNGLGIDQEHHEKIFEAFSRVDRTGQIDGEGLGLSIAAKILERNNGSIRVESEAGKGSKFFVTLPSI